MKTLIAAIAFTAALLAFHVEVHAQCVTNGIMQGGRYTVCTTCCTGGICNTVCS